MKRTSFRPCANGYEAEWEVAPAEDLTDEMDLYANMEVRANSGTDGILNPTQLLESLDKNGELSEEVQINWSKEDLLKFYEEKERDENEYGVRLDETTEYERYKKGMKQLSDPDGSDPVKVWKKTLRTGIESKPVKLSDAVTYHYQAWHEGLSEPYDSTVIRGRPIIQRLSVDPIVPGLLVGLLSMNLGEKSEFLVDYRLAYGELGCPPRIPAKADILFRVEILKIHAEGSLECYNALTDEERDRVPTKEFLEIIQQSRVAANTYFKENRFHEAACRYRMAITQMEGRMWKGEAEELESRELHVRLLANFTLVFLKLGRPIPAIKYAKRAIELDANNLKARHLLARAYFTQGSLDDALKHNRECLRAKPDNADFNRLRLEIEERRTRDARRQDALYGAMSRAILQGKQRNQDREEGSDK